MIREITEFQDLETVKELFQEYAASLQFDLGFQNFNEELADLPAQYAPPAGCILLATIDDLPAGCVALKPLAHLVCEMKRLYVRPHFRGKGLGRELAIQIIDVARNRGYRRVQLDTISTTMAAAAALYESLGFTSITAYYDNPIPHAKFMTLEL